MDKTLVRELGRTPREHLTWLLERFAYLDLDQLADGQGNEIEELLKGLVALAGPSGWGPADAERGPVSIEELKETQAVVRGVVEMIAGRRPVMLASHAVEREDPKFPGMLRRIEIFGGVVVRGIDPSGTSVLILGVDLPLPDAVAVTAVYLATPDLLRRCPYYRGVTKSASRPADARDCGRVFVPRKRQKWCAVHQKEVRREQNQEAYDTFMKNKRRAKRRKGGGR